MGRSLKSVLTDLDLLSPEDFDDGQPGLERLGELCDELAELNQPERAAPAMFAFAERMGDADLGSPGPLVHTLEQWRGLYEQSLMVSLRRQPTPCTVWMLNRLLNAPSTQRSAWLSLLRDVAVHPQATPETKAQAKDFLRFQGRS